MMKSCEGNAINTCPLERENVIFFSMSMLPGQQPQHCRASTAPSQGWSCKSILEGTTLELLLEELAEWKQAAYFGEEAGGFIEMYEQQHL